MSPSYSERPPTRAQVLDRRRWDAAAQVRRAQAERASRRGAELHRQPQGHTVWEAMQGAALLERDEWVRERRRLRAQEEEDAELARAIHFSQLDGVWPPGPEVGTAGALPRPLTPLERHTAMADSGSRATSASEFGLSTGRPRAKATRPTISLSPAPPSPSRRPRRHGRLPTPSGTRSCTRFGVTPYPHNPKLLPPQPGTRLGGLRAGS